MNTINSAMKPFKRALLLLALASATLSCSKEDVGFSPDEPTQSYKVVLDVNHSDYENAATKADYQWSDGAKLYIHFSNKENTQTYPSVATYSSATKTWTIPAPQGELNRGDSTACTVVFINKEIEGEIISLTTDDVIYEDTNAKYFLGSETLTIKANLSPKTARIRFKGTAGSTIKLYGTSSYTKYNPSYNTFGTTDKEMELKVAQDGYTPYIHTFFPNDIKRLEITDSNNKIFVFKCSSAHLAAGVSRYFNIPTEQDKQGWTMHEPVMTFKVKDAEFKMIYVQWINGSFYIAETETTQKLWFAVTGYNPSLNWSDKLELPVDNIPADDTYNFVIALQNLTGYNFNFPTKSQWLFAAQGGNKSMGYKYSGSNDIDEVAWYQGNASGTTHIIKSKMPNELGIYDMTGNVWERINWGTHDYCGGSYNREEKYCNILSEHFMTSYSHSGSSNIGIRLCLNI